MSAMGGSASTIRRLRPAPGTGAGSIVRGLFVAVAVLVASLPADRPAAAETPTAEARAIIESERFQRLAHELRCLVCQNQSLADSNAPLAQDLRNEVVRLIVSGRDDPAIKAFLVDRYGEFVLYRPPVSARNALLWAGPFALLLIGGLIWWRLGHRAGRPAGPTPPSPASGTAQSDAQAALRRVDELLDRDR